MASLSKQQKAAQQIKIRLGKTIYNQFPKNPKFKAYLIIHNIGEEAYENMPTNLRFKALFEVFYAMKIEESHPMFGKGYDVYFSRIIDWNMFVEIFKKSCEDCCAITRQNFSFDDVKDFINWLCNPKFVFPANVNINYSRIRESSPVPEEILNEIAQYIQETKKTARAEELKYRAGKMAEYNKKARETFLSNV